MSSPAVNTIHKYIQKFAGDYSPILYACADAATIYTYKRKYVLDIEFPAVERIELDEIEVKAAPEPPSSNDYFKLNSIPPLSAIREAVNKCSTLEYPKNALVTMKHYTFTMEDLESLLRIHHLKDIKHRVQDEMKWLMVPTKAPPSSPPLNDSLIRDFGALLLEGYDHVTVSPDQNDFFHRVMCFELAALASKRWIWDSLINAFTFYINMAYYLSRTLTNTFLQNLDDETLGKMVQSWKEYGIQSCCVILNVSKTESGDETLIANRGESGNHWSCMYMNLESKTLVYADSLGWPLPINIDSSLQGLLSQIEQHYQFRLDMTTIKLAHDHDNITLCTNQCLGLPFQGESYNVCGLASLISAMMLVGNCSLIRKKGNWTTKLEEYEPYLRRFFICCFMTRKIVPIDQTDVDNLVQPDNDNGQGVHFDSDVHQADDTTSNVDETNPEQHYADAVRDDVDLSNYQSDNTTENLVDEELKENIPPSDNIEPTDILYVGKQFLSFFDLCQAMQDFGQKHGVELQIISSCTLKAAEKKAPRRVSIANPALEYYSLFIGCKFSGNPAKTRTQPRKKLPGE